MDGVANGAARCAICKSIICSRAVRSVMTQRRISSPYAPGVTNELIFYSDGPHTDLIVSSKSGSVSRSKDRRTNLTHQSNSSAIKSTSYPQTHVSRETVVVHHRHPDNLNSVAVFDNLVCVQITHKVPRDFVAFSRPRRLVAAFPKLFFLQSQEISSTRVNALGACLRSLHQNRRCPLNTGSHLTSMIEPELAISLELPGKTLAFRCQLENLGFDTPPFDQQFAATREIPNRPDSCRELHLRGAGWLTSILRRLDCRLVL